MAVRLRSVGVTAAVAWSQLIAVNIQSVRGITEQCTICGVSELHEELVLFY